MTDAFVLGGVRTPLTRYGGSLSHIRLDDLLGLAMTAACERVGVGRGQIEDIVAGCVNPAHEGMGDIARWALLAAGFPDSVAGAIAGRVGGRVGCGGQRWIAGIAVVGGVPAGGLARCRPGHGDASGDIRTNKDSPFSKRKAPRASPACRHGDCSVAVAGR
jgi:hypothetical protein